MIDEGRKHEDFIKMVVREIRAEAECQKRMTSCGGNYQKSNLSVSMLDLVSAFEEVI